MDFYVSGSDECGINVHMLRVLEYLAPLDEDDVLRYLAPLGSDDSCQDVVARIMEQRTTQFGWRDFCHCYDVVAAEYRRDIVTFRSAVLRYAEALHQPPGQRVHVALCLYMAPRLIATGEVEPAWHAFHRGVWSPISKASVWNAAYNFVSEPQVADRLGLGTSPDGARVHKLLTQLLRRDGLAYAMLYVDGFEHRRDDKDTVFAMPGGTYDIGHGIVRSALPGDMATMSSTVDMDYHAWRERRTEMMRVLVTWMSGRDVANTYLDIVASAMSEFLPRYGVVNYGTGSDGKSTWFLILNAIFGSYCAMLPGTGPAMGSRSGNDATPLANLLVGKRLCLTADSGDVMRILRSPDFKSMTGGDPFYLRGMYREAETVPRRLKQLAMINTNSASMSAHEISMLTRVKVFMWTSKTVAEEDLAAIPSHQLERSSIGTFGYETTFLRKYGATLITELLIRHRDLRSKSMRIEICDTVREWTRDMLKPRTILAFMECCTESAKDEEHRDDDTLPIDLVGHDPKGTFLSTLFAVYTTWRRSSGRMSPNDPTTIDAFKGHVEHYYPVTKEPVPSSGRLDDYVRGVVLKSGFDMLSPSTLRIGGSFYGSNAAVSSTASSVYTRELCDRYVVPDDDA